MTYHEPASSAAVYTVSDEDIFSDLLPDQRQRIVRQIGSAEYPAGQIFYAPEDVGEQIFFLWRGRVRIYKLSPEGRALTLLILEPPAVFGEMALSEQWQHDSFAETMNDCAIGMIGRRELRQVLNQYPPVTMRFMDLMSRRLRALESKLVDIAFKSVPRRLATVLLNLADHQAGHVPAVVRYTHQQLAEMIGSYRETVTKAIGGFRESGLLRVEDDTIYLTDLVRLHQLAGC